MALKPTLWRTCRTLANRTRLRLFGLVVLHPGLTVDELAEQAGVRPPVASGYLRALNARGLLQARRKGRFVSYWPVADSSVAGAATLLHALAAEWRDSPATITKHYRQLTAYTHVRRIQIVATLEHAACSLQDLQQQTHISPPALRRHLRKLVQRGVVKHAKGLYRLKPQKDTVAATLLRLSCGSEGL